MNKAVTHDPAAISALERFPAPENLVWSETHASVEVQRGLFSVLLGSWTNLDISHFPFDAVGSTNRWLEVRVGSDLLSPTKEFVSVPYAFRASDADTLDGFHADDLTYTGQAPISITSYDTAPTLKMVIDSAGNVGIGTTSPGYKLHVAGDIYANSGWLRTSGSQGWYSESYGGGWFMQDSSWIRTYNSKSVWTAGGLLGSDGGLTVGYGGTGPSGGGAVIAGNVGIGTPSPAYKLDVNGNGRINGPLVIGEGQPITSITTTPPPFPINWYPSLTLAQWAYYQDNYGYATIIKPGELGFGVMGNFLKLIMHSRMNGDLWILSKYLSASDDRIKLNEQTLEYGLAQVMALEPKRYDLAEYEYDPETEEFVVHPEKTTNEIGLVAQDVQKVIPEAVSVPEDENSQLWSLSYDTIIPVLVKAIQEQQTQIEELKNEIQAMKSGI